MLDLRGALIGAFFLASEMAPGRWPGSYSKATSSNQRGSGTVCHVSPGSGRSLAGNRALAARRRLNLLTLGQGPGIANQGPGIGSGRPRSDGIGPASPVRTGRTPHMVCTKKARGKCAFWNAHDTWPVGNENILITTYCGWVPRPIKVIY